MGDRCIEEFTALEVLFKIPKEFYATVQKEGGWGNLYQPHSLCGIIFFLCLFFIKIHMIFLVQFGINKHKVM